MIRLLGQLTIGIGVIFLKTEKIMPVIKIGIRADTFCTESGNPENSIKLDRKIYEKCNSNETHHHILNSSILSLGTNMKYYNFSITQQQF
jgi:hypothetical protein